MVRMDDPSTWPMPYLPLQRPAALFPELGLLVGPEPVVYEVALHEATPQKLAYCPKLRYRSFEALKADGWQID